jgi:hypothetical protein
MASPKIGQLYCESWKMPELPFRQDDPEWSSDTMWNRDDVMAVHQKYNRKTKAEASGLLRYFRGGNTIGNEGCLLTCLAMILRILDQSQKQYWSPRTLNNYAQEQCYYTTCGLSMATLYADLVCEASKGEVQLLLKEEYLSGEEGWEPTYANTCLPLRAYRALTEPDRKNVVIMVKVGTYDDTVGSHFLLMDQAKPGKPADKDFIVLDPAEPPGEKATWRLSESCHRIRQDPKINQAWKKAKVVNLQLAGVWVFARWPSATDKCLGKAFLLAQALGH